jgi:hypothetical protein
MMAICHRLHIYCYYNKQSDGSLLPSPSSLVVFKWRKQ